MVIAAAGTGDESEMKTHFSIGEGGGMAGRVEEMF